MPGKRDIQAGRAYVEMYVKNSKLIRGLRDVQKRLASFGSGLQSIGIKALGAGAGIATAFIPAITAASNLQEVMNKFDVVFGENRDAVKAWSDDFAGEMGRSKRQIAEFMASSQDLFVPLGFDEKAATEMSKQITGLSLDLASFNNKADEDVMNDLQAALTGSGEVMKKYGVILSEAAVKQELMTMGMSKKQAAAASDVAKVQARLNIIMRGTTAAQGDVIRSSGSLANVTKAIRGGIEDLAGEIGNALLPDITALAVYTKNIVKQTAGWVKENKPLIATIFKVATGLAVAGSLAVALGTGIISIGTVCGAATIAIAFIGKAIAVVTGIFGAILSPIGLVVVAIGGLVAYFLWASDSISGVLDWLKGGFGVLKDDALSAFGGISDALANGDIQLAAKILWAFLKLEWQRGLNWLESLWEGFKSFWADGVTGIAIYFTEAVAGVKTAWVSMIGFIKKKWNDFSNSKFTESLADWIAPIVASIYGQDVEGVRANLKQDFATKRKQSGNYNAEVDAETAQRKAEIEAQKQGAIDQLGQDVANRQGERNRKELEAQGKLDAAKAEMAALIAEAKGKVGENQGELGNGPKKPGEIPAPGLPSTKQLAGAGTAIGTFSASQASMLGGGMSMQERTYRTAVKQAKTLDEIRAINRKMYLQTMEDRRQIATS